MIYDNLDNIERYSGVCTNMKIVIDFLKSNNLKNLTSGKHILDVDKCYLNIIDTKTKHSSELKYELHKKYYDIHIVLEGKEKIDFVEKEESVLCSDYNEDDDFALYEGEERTSILMEEGKICICLIGELHKPCVSVSNDSYLKKCIIKVRNDDF